MKIPIFWLVVTAVLLAIILLQRACSPSAKCPTITAKSDTTYIRVTDTILKEKLVPIEKIVNHRPAPVTVTDTVFLTDVMPVDTIAILADYFATRNYSDTNRLESYGNIIINDAITQNKVRNREIIYNLNIPEVTKTLAVPNKNQVWIGLDISGTKTWIGAGGQFTLKTKTDKMYHLGAMFTTENSVFYHIGTSWKIHF